MGNGRTDMARGLATCGSFTWKAWHQLLSLPSPSHKFHVKEPHATLQVTSLAIHALHTMPGALELFKQYCLNVAQRINKFGQLCNRTSWQWRRSGGEGKEEAWQKNKAMLVLYPIRNVWDTIRKNYIQIILILLTSPSLEKQRIKSSGGSRGMLLQPSSSWLYRPRPPSTSSGACTCQNEVYSTFQHKLSFGLTAHPSVCIRTRENIDVAFGDSVGWVNIAVRCNFFKLTLVQRWAPS